MGEGRLKCASLTLTVTLFVVACKLFSIKIFSVICIYANN